MITPILNNTRPIDFVKRALMVGLINTAIAVMLRLGKPDGFSFLEQFTYSQSIGLSCWALIDFGRFFVKRPAGSEWPVGWRAFALPAVGTVAGNFIGSAIATVLTGHAWGAWLAKSPAALRGQLFFMALVGLTTSYFFWARGRSLMLETMVEETRREAAEAQLRVLQTQLEPHMLFNTLANLHVLIGEDPRRAQELLDHLIAYLRSTLAASRATQHALSIEFARTADYLALMKIRMGDRLQTEADLPDALGTLQVPTLLLQPLVENAIKHGLEPHVAGGRLTVRARQDGSHLMLTVRDTGAGLDQPASDGTHFGLVHVRQRLATLYGDQASLTLTNATDGQGGTLACVRLPL